jgi:uncharacterized membrane protein
MCNKVANAYLRGWLRLQTWLAYLGGYLDGAVHSILNLAHWNHTAWQELDEREVMEKSIGRTKVIVFIMGCLGKHPLQRNKGKLIN